MTEEQLKAICEELASDEYQLAIAGARLCIEKMNHSALCRNEVGAAAAAQESLEFYDRALKVVRKGLERVDARNI